MRNRLLLLLTAVGAVVLVVRAWSFGFLADDAFITLRYLRNLLEGEGLVFNPGERVEGYTNFGWLLALAPFGAAGADLVLAARVLGVVCGAGVLFVVAGGARRMSGDSSFAAPVAVLLVVASAPSACWAGAGMETTCFALLAVSVATTTGWRAGLFAGLAAVTRPEGLLLGAIAIGFTAFGAPRRERWRAALASALPFVLLVGAHLAFRVTYYGEWLPNTFHAKVGGASHAIVERGVDYLALFARENGGLLLYALPLVGVAWRRDRAWWQAFAALVLLAAAVVAVGGDGLPMYRFAVPLVPLWSLLAAAFVADVARVRPPVTAGAGAALAAVGIALVSMGPPAQSVQRGRMVAQRDLEVPVWSAVGRWLAANASPGESVACVPIGAIGYYSALPLVDMLGLTDAHIARVDVPAGEGWAGHEKHDGPYVLARRPTYLLLGNVTVYEARVPLDHPDLFRLSHPVVRAREGDLVGPELERLYERAEADLGDGLWLYYVRLRD
ncbi:MAG: hypothetical protein AAF726_22640 [Planctomycetota bacterium]